MRPILPLLSLGLPLLAHSAPAPKATSVAAQPTQSHPSQLYQGVDRATNYAKPSPFAPVTSPDAVVATNDPVNINATLCTSAADFNQTMAMSTSDSVGWTGGNVKATGSATDDLTTSNNDTYIVVQIRMPTGVQTASMPVFRDDAPLPTDAKSLRHFVTTYGDSYVSQITQGAELVAIYDFHTVTAEEKKDLEASLGGSGGSGSITVDANFEASLKSASKKNQVSCDYYFWYRGLSGPMPDGDHLVSYALGLQPSDITAPVTLSYSTLPYENCVTDPSSCFDVLTRNRQVLCGRSLDNMDKDCLFHKLSKLRRLNKNIANLMEAYSIYGQPSADGGLASARAQVSADINAIQKQITAYENNPGLPLSSDLSTPSVNWGSPYMSFNVYQSNVYGGKSGGLPFNDVDNILTNGSSYDFVKKGAQLRSIQFVSDVNGWLDGFLTSYTYPGQDSLHHRITAEWPNGFAWPAGQPHLLTHGLAPETAVVQSAVKLNDKEFITHITGSYANIVGPFYTLTFTTNQQQRRPFTGGLNTAPASNAIIQAFTWDVPPNSVFLGFSGMSGQFPNNLQFVYATFDVAKWDGNGPDGSQ